tara:strand:+ start:54 stop:332 length:279 start_codon:yes stop_codon:yes gene_type:complete
MKLKNQLNNLYIKSLIPTTNQALCKRLTDAWDKEYNRNLKDEERGKRLDDINDALKKRDKEIFEALNFIRFSDSSTESAAKAIEMLNKYENV